MKVRLFAAEQLQLVPTVAWRDGRARVVQCAHCGLLAAVPDCGELRHDAPLGACPRCGRMAWWEQDVPVGPYKAECCARSELEGP